MPVVRVRPASPPRRNAPPAPPVQLADLVKSLPIVPGKEGTAARTRPTAWGPGVLAVIEWRRFEALVEALFAQAGFETKSLSHGADEGVDIWLYSKSQPDGQPVSIVQCKHWQGKRVGVDKVRELRGVMAARDVRRGQFATTSIFTPEAIAFGRDNGINLLDVGGLLALITKRTPEQQQALLDVALEGDYWRPTCVNCGIKMIERAPRKGGSAFWGLQQLPALQDNDGDSGRCSHQHLSQAGRASNRRSPPTASTPTNRSATASSSFASAPSAASPRPSPMSFGAT